MSLLKQMLEEKAQIDEAAMENIMQLKLNELANIMVRDVEETAKHFASQQHDMPIKEFVKEELLSLDDNGGPAYARYEEACEALEKAFGRALKEAAKKYK